MQDVQYQTLPTQLNELKHEYGNNVHILSDPYLMTLLADLCHPATHQPRVSQLLTVVYRQMVGMVATHAFARSHHISPTRMGSQHPEGVYAGQLINRNTKAVIVDIARAGMVPSQIVFEHLCQLLEPTGVRQDHLYMNRKSNEAGEVVGIDLSGSKIGGDIEDAVVFFPDPMGATGGSLCQAVGLYKGRGVPAQKVAMHLIVTPEYLKRVTQTHPDLAVYAIRLDRGLSSKEVLKTTPGTHWAQEKGLDDHQYIVPGAGGFGEVINNAYV